MKKTLWTIMLVNTKMVHSNEICLSVFSHELVLVVLRTAFLGFTRNRYKMPNCPKPVQIFCVMKTSNHATCILNDFDYKVRTSHTTI